jgi:dUTP pyrophosphatase
MEDIKLNVDTDIWAQIRDQFEKVKQEAGIEPDQDYQKELEELLGFSDEEMQREFESSLRTQTIEVELINKDAKLPSYAYPSDSGFDLFASESITMEEFSRALVPTGVKLSFSEGFEVQIRPKSGLAYKQGITVLNTPGTIDSGYNGEIKIILFNTNKHAITIEKGQKIAQAVLCPVIVGKYVNLHHVNKIGDTDRGDNGFGSTGIK